MCDYLVAENSSVGKVRKYDQCLGIFENQNDLINDDLTGHGEGCRFRCEICGKRFWHESTFRIHLVSHSNERNFKCGLCDKTFKYKNALNKHKRYICLTSFAAAYFRNKLLTEDAGGKRHKCEECSKVYKCSWNLRAHKVVIHAAVEKYDCNVCGRTYTDVSRLKRHMSWHRKEEQHKTRQCEMCGGCFKVAAKHSRGPLQCENCSKDNLVLNLKSNLMKLLCNDKQKRAVKEEPDESNENRKGDSLLERRVDKPHKCAKTVTHPYEPKQHLQEKETPHKCEVCRGCFKTAAGLSKHKFLIHQKLPFQCEMCLSKFPTALSLKKHTKNKHEKKCDLCYKTFKIQPDLTNHTEIEHTAFEIFYPSCVNLSPLPAGLENVIYKCNQCDNACPPKRRVDKPHKRAKTITHPYKPKQHLHDKETPHKCELCSVCYKTAAGLANHKFLLHQKLPFQCDMCPSNFQTALTLERHTKNKHEKKCDLCYKTFKTQPDLTNHKEQEHGIKPDLPCNVCGKTFQLQGQLDEHILWHANEKLFKCDQCDKKYSTQRDLADHKEYLHATGTSFQCEACQETFNSAMALKTHSAHHNEFKCNQCPKTFSSQLILTKHKSQVHESDREFLCEICGKTFTPPSEFGNRKFPTQNVLRVHKNMSHLGKPSIQCEDCLKSFKLNLKANLSKFVGLVNNAEEVGTFEEVDVKEEPVQLYDPKLDIKDETQEDVDVKEEPEKVELS